MPCWYYDKNELRDTPSVRDGIPLEAERRYRKEGARFIMTCGTQMGLGHNTMATGVVYFHRFYMFQSFKQFPRYVTACCCLLLAGKVEETPKKCRDIILIARQLLTENHFYSFGKEPKEEVITLERILLQTIKFDLQVEHPYTFLLRYAKCFKGDQQKLQKMVQMAWNFVNDSLSTVVCLQWEPEIIAVALIYLASKLSKFTVTDWIGRQPQHTRWWDMFVSDVTMDILEDICHQVLDLYQSNSKESTENNSPPQKPPSRADSPTPMKSVLPSTNHSGSPAGKTKPMAAANSSSSSTSSLTSVSEATNNTQNIKPIPTIASSIPTVPPATIDHPTTHAVPSSSSYHHPPHHHIAAAPSHHHSMYTAMPPMAGPWPMPPPAAGGYPHAPVPNISGPNAGGGVIPPPLPPPPQPMVPYCAPSSYGPPSHFASVPPPIPPGSTGPVGVGGAPPPPPGVESHLPPPSRGGGGGYYQPPPPGNYVGGGRQRY
ncbi:cyclin-K [Stomoxys calcitrans]|uniref:Cyclin-K n=1 Tax=Stomoxys calcitrans TaxID=35570 RepID=A0A1I8P0K8_STOCA|nr:cyclin-K [Stomoxys calcitrans]